MIFLQKLCRLLVLFLFILSIVFVISSSLFSRKEISSLSVFQKKVFAYQSKEIEKSMIQISEYENNKEKIVYEIIVMEDTFLSQITPLHISTLKKIGTHSLIMSQHLEKLSLSKAYIEIEKIDSLTSFSIDIGYFYIKDAYNSKKPSFYHKTYNYKKNDEKRNLY